MNIEIRKLSPDLAEDYARFFDVTPHSNQPDDDDKKCYCVWACNDDQDNTVIKRILSSRERRREYAIRNIRGDKIRGYLAYSDDKVVGWCNANAKADCLKSYCGRDYEGSVFTEELKAGIRIKSVYCFMIDLEMRREGISKRLLERVCQDAAQDGFDFVEAQPLKGFLSEARDYMGPAELYKKSGFTVYFETEDRLIMRKPLK